MTKGILSFTEKFAGSSDGFIAPEIWEQALRKHEEKEQTYVWRMQKLFAEQSSSQQN